MSQIIKIARAVGQPVQGEVIVFKEGFSPRYDLDRTTGVISRRGHSAEGQSLKDKILIIPTAKGGVAGGWAFRELVHKGFGPKAFVFGKTNPTMVEGAVLAKVLITEGWTPDATTVLHTGDVVRIDPQKLIIEKV